MSHFFSNNTVQDRDREVGVMEDHTIHRRKVSEKRVAVARQTGGSGLEGAVQIVTKALNFPSMVKLREFRPLISL